MLSHDNDINEALRSLMCFRAGQQLSALQGVPKKSDTIEIISLFLSRS